MSERTCRRKYKHDCIKEAAWWKEVFRHHKRVLLKNCCYDIQFGAFALVVSFTSLVWVVTQRFTFRMCLNNTVGKDSWESTRNDFPITYTAFGNSRQIQYGGQCELKSQETELSSRKRKVWCTEYRFAILLFANNSAGGPCDKGNVLFEFLWGKIFAHAL